MNLLDVVAWILVIWAIALFAGSFIFHLHNRKK